MHYIFFPFFLWEGLFHLVEWTKVRGLNAKVLSLGLESCDRHFSAFLYPQSCVRETVADLGVGWSLYPVTPCLWGGITKETAVQFPQIKITTQDRPIYLPAASEYWLSHSW